MCKNVQWQCQLARYPQTIALRQTMACTQAAVLFLIETIKESDAFGLHSSRHQVDIILIETVEESDAYELVNAT